MLIGHRRMHTRQWGSVAHSLLRDPGTWPRWNRWRVTAAVVALVVMQALGAAIPVRAAVTPGSLYAVALTQPTGGLWLANHLWISEQGGPWCRVDRPTPDFLSTTGSLIGGINTTTCVNGARSTREQLLQFLRSPGQPSFDAATNSVYIPDFSPRGAGLWRFTFDPTTETIVDLSGVVLARTAGLNASRPTASALGPDGNLYVGSLGTGDIKRVTTPTGLSQTVQVIGKSALGNAVYGLAFIGPDLYLAETNGLTVIRNAVACQAGCVATSVPGVAAVATTGIATSGAGTLYVVQAPDVLRYTVATGAVSVYASSGTLPAGYTDPPAVSSTVNCVAGACPFTFPAGATSGLALDPQGALYIAEDPGVAAAVGFEGRLWQVPTVQAVAVPTITSAPAALTNLNTPTFTFASSQPGVTFQCSLVTTGAPDAYSACAAPKTYGPLADGAYTFKVRAVDATGNVSVPATAAVTIDTVAPVVTLTGQPAALSNVGTPTFSFTSSKAGVTFQCSLITTGATDAFAPCASPQSYALTDGAYTFKVLATDAAGNVSAPVSYAFTIDTVAPVVSITSQPASPTNVTTPAFSFTSSKAGSTFQCSLSTGLDAFAPCVSPLTYAAQPDGAYTFKVVATDPAGNSSAPVSYAFTIDTVAPTVSASPLGGTYSAVQSVTLAASKPGATIYYTLDGSAPTALSPTYATPLSIAATTTLTYLAIDPAGNQSAIGSQTYTIAALAVTPALPALASGSGYAYTFRTTYPGTIQATWAFATAQSASVSIYSGHPYSGLGNPIKQGPKSGALAQDTQGGKASYSATTSLVPAGQYTVYFFNAGGTNLSGTAGVTYMK